MGLPFLIILCSILTIQSYSQDTTTPPPGFRCTNPTTTTCNSLIDYKLPNTTTLSAITDLFQIKNLRQLLGANNLSLTTPKTHQFNGDHVLKIPFPCLCQNGTGISNHRPIYTVVPDDGLYHIAAEVFSRLVVYQQIQSVNNIPDADNITVGQELWIPLPCSCDDVDGGPVVHYGYLVPAGSSVGGIAQQFNTTETTLLDLNGMTNSSKLLADSIIDVPLKVCTTSISSNSTDYPLHVPNNTYTITANGCVQCQCNAATSWILNCQSSGINLHNGRTCPSTQCPGTAFDLGNTTADSGCSLSRCSYGGFINNTIYTQLTQESTCPGGSGNNNSSSPGNSLSGLRWNFVLGASFIVLHLMRL
ncbi:lysM domain-containing GPI-anchored protein 2-like [Bidens hawaiensis]|uniref:lysM domain-containing GPI-anchored protein 2-like n=1 Tax=Bidens hawaiensis TaxID=980011 RepID=UPI00404A25DD